MKTWPMDATPARDSHPVPSPVARMLSYVLVADTDGRRIAICLDALKPHGVGVLVARRSDEAVGVLRNFGLPSLLIVDLLLPRETGLSAIEAVRRLDANNYAGILAWSPARDVREFATCLLAGMNARILSGGVAPAVVRRAIDRMMRAGAERDIDESFEQSVDPSDKTMAELAETARGICGTAGVAVYLRRGPDRPFRSSLTWLSDEPIPRTVDYLPTALKRVIETRAPVLALNLSSDRSFEGSQPGLEGLRGLVAVPIVVGPEDEVAGMICVFDVEALAFGSEEIEALKAAGRTRNRTGLPAGTMPAGTISPRGARRTSDVAQDRGFGPPPPGPAVLLDRRGGSLAVAREMARARRKDSHLSLVKFDVKPADGVEASASSDDPVDSVGQALLRVIRPYDLAIRWSHQELLIVLPGVRETGAGHVAERMRRALGPGVGGQLSTVGGLVELDDDHTLESLVVRAAENFRAR